MIRRFLLIIVFCLLSFFTNAQTEIEEIIRSKEGSLFVFALPDNDLLLFETNQVNTNAYRIKVNGEVLSTTIIDGEMWDISVFPESENIKVVSPDPLKKKVRIGVFDKEFNYTETGMFVVEEDSPNIIPCQMNVYRRNEGTYVMSYIDAIEHHRMGIIKFNNLGEVLGEYIINSWNTGYIFVPDETNDGYYFAYITQKEGYPRSDCFWLDADLNITLHHEDIYQGIPCQTPLEVTRSYRHPQNGELYVVGTYSAPPYNGNPLIKSDVVIARFDSSVHFSDLSFGYASPSTTDQVAAFKPLDFLPDGTIMVCSSVGMIELGGPGDIYIAHYDESLRKCDELYYHNEEQMINPYQIVRISDGSYVVTATCMDRRTFKRFSSLFHIPVEAFLGVEEAHASGLRVAVAYPNPGGGEMRLRTTVEDAEGVVYDMNGRLVARQPLTQTETSFDATQWPSGTYLWNVTAHGKTVESGKWVKE